MNIEAYNGVLSTVLRVAVYLILLLGLVTLFFAGPRLEVLLYPVWGKFEITRAWQEDGAYYMEGILLKNRGHCEPLSMNLIAFGDAEDRNSKLVLVEAALEYAGDEPLGYRPAGAQHWGPWKLTQPLPPLGPLVRLVVTHRCHFLWTTEQIGYEGPTETIFPDYVREDADGIQLGGEVPGEAGGSRSSID